MVDPASVKIVVSLVVLTSILGLDLAIGAPSGREPGSEEYEWLLVVLMAADNSLGENGTYGNAAWMDLEEMEAYMPGSGVRALVLSDMKGDGNTHLFDISHHPAPGLGSASIPLSEVNATWDDEIRSSDWRALRDLLVYSLRETDARRVMLGLWDHGSGWVSLQADPSTFPGRSFAQDVTDGGTMDMRGLRSALAEAEGSLGELHLDVVAFDICFMSSMEVIHQIGPWTDISIAAADEQPFYGFNYSFISRMGGPAPLGPRELSGHIVQMFSSEYDDPEWYPYSGVAAVDVPVLTGDLTRNLDELSREMWGWMYDTEVVSGGLVDKAILGAEDLSPSQRDLGDLLDRIASAGMPGDIGHLAKSARANLTRSVIHEYHVPGGRNPRFTGVSIYGPYKTFYINSYDGDSGLLSFTAETYWDEMLRERSGPVERLRIGWDTAALDGDSVADDLTVTVSDPTEDDIPPLAGANVTLEGIGMRTTGPDGTVLYRNLSAGRYVTIARWGLARASADPKVLNNAPVLVFEMSSAEAVEGMDHLIDASSSFDPDGDPLTFDWDTDPSDGLTFEDSIHPAVRITWDRAGLEHVHLRLSDGTANVTHEFSIEVLNIGPQLVVRGPSAVYEDEGFIINASETSDSPNDMRSLLFRFEMGGSVVRDWSPDPVLAFSIPGSGEYVFNVQAKDDDGNVSSREWKVRVYNVAPEVTIQGPGSAYEDSSFVLRASVTDTASDRPTVNLTWRYTRTWDVLGHGPDLAIALSESGPHNISVEAVDDDAFSAIAYHSLTVINVDPIPSFELPFAVEESEVFTLDASDSIDSVSDAPVLGYEWDLDADGSIDHTGMVANASFSRPGLRTVRLIVTDDDGSSSFLDRQTTVLNVRPYPALDGPLTLIEDETGIFTVEGSSDTENDQGSLGYSWTVNGETVTGSESELSISFPRSGTYDVAVIVTDDQGEKGLSRIEVDVTNIPPSAVILGPPLKVDAGASFVLMGRGNDTASDLLSLIYRWTVDGVIISEGPDSEIAISLRDPGDHTIVLTVIDDDGDEGTASPLTIEAVGVDRNDLSALLIGAIVVIILFGSLSFLFMMKQKGLPVAEVEPVLEGVGEVAGFDPDGSEPAPDLDPPDDVSDGLAGSEGSPPELREPEEIRAVEIPPPPSIGTVEVEPADGSIFD